MEDIVIVGSGGMAREVKFVMDRINRVKSQWNFLGYVDCQKKDGVIGDDDWLLKQNRELAVVIAIGSSKTRQKIVEIYSQNENLRYPNIIDPSAILSEEKIVLGQGNIICANSLLTTDLKVGNFNIINYSVTIGHDSMIEDYATINPGCNISGNVTIENCVEIGTGSQVLQGRTIKNKSIIGAGAVVIDDIEECSTAVGVPAKIIKSRR